MLMWGGERERARGAGTRCSQGAMVFLPKISAFICFLLPDEHQGCKIDAIKHSGLVTASGRVGEHRIGANDGRRADNGRRRRQWPFAAGRGHCFACFGPRTACWHMAAMLRLVLPLTFYFHRIPAARLDLFYFQRHAERPFGVAARFPCGRRQDGELAADRLHRHLRQLRHGPLLSQVLHQRQDGPGQGRRGQDHPLADGHVLHVHLRHRFVHLRSPGRHLPAKVRTQDSLEVERRPSNPRPRQSDIYPTLLPAGSFSPTRTHAPPLLDSLPSLLCLTLSCAA